MRGDNKKTTNTNNSQELIDKYSVYFQGKALAGFIKVMNEKNSTDVLKYVENLPICSSENLDKPSFFSSFNNHKKSKEDAVLLIRCLVQVYSKEVVFDYLKVLNFNDYIDYIPKEHLAYAYMTIFKENFTLLNVCLDAVALDMNDYANLYENATDFNDKTALVCIMINDEIMVEKYHLIDMLERLLTQIFNNISGELLETFNKCDINNYNNFIPIFTQFSDYLLRNPNKVFIAQIMFLILNKSEFLNKFAMFLIYYNLTNDTDNTISSWRFDFKNTELIENNIKVFITKNPEFKSLLAVSLTKLYKQGKELFVRIYNDEINPIIISSEEYSTFILQNPYLNVNKDFITGESNYCDYFYAKDFDFEYEEAISYHNLNFTNLDNAEYKFNLILAKNSLYFGLFYFINDDMIKYLLNYFDISNSETRNLSLDLIKRLRLIYLTLTTNHEEAYDIFKLVIISTDILDQVTLSESMLHRILSTKIGKQCYSVDSYAGDSNFEIDFMQRLSKYYINNPDFVRKFCVDTNVYTIADRICMIVGMVNLGDTYLQEFSALEDDTSKLVGNALLYAYRKNDIFTVNLTSQLHAKKVGIRKLAFEMLTALDKTRYLPEIRELFEVEKNAKFKTQLDIFLNETSITELNALDCENNTDISSKISLLLKQENIIKFIPVDVFSKVYLDITIIKASLIAFAKDRVTGFSPLADEILNELNKENLKPFAIDLFNFYVEGYPEPKDKWILFYSSIYGGVEILPLYSAMIDEFIFQSRGAMAGEVVSALALNSSDKVLPLIENISRKYKHKQVKKSAIDALNFVSKKRNVSAEELADLIVPDYNFDQDMKLIFDYGTRKFYVTLNFDLDLEVIDEKGKVLKTLPKVGKTDNSDIATKSFNQFKVLKKDIKETIKTQNERLQKALINGRTWSYESFISLFIKNPIMYKFANTIIWGVYEKGELKSTFGYSYDGGYNDVFDNEFTLNPDMIIGIAHPCEMGEKLATDWLEQIINFELKQSISQLDRVVTLPQKSDLDKGFISFDSNEKYTISTLKTRLEKLGFIPGAVLDAGCFHEFINTEICPDFTVKLTSSGISITYFDGVENECTLNKLSFLDLAGNEIEISKVKTRYLSEILTAIAGCLE